MNLKIAKQTIVLGIILLILSFYPLKSFIPVWIGPVITIIGISKILSLKIKAWIDSRESDVDDKPTKRNILLDTVLQFSIGMVIAVITFFVFRGFGG